MDLTVVIPFWNGHAHIERLLDSLPDGLPVVIVDDHSDTPLNLDDYPRKVFHADLPTRLEHGGPVIVQRDIRILRPRKKGYFTGAVNAGLKAARGDVLIVNQDVWFEGIRWLNLLADNRDEYGLIGEGIAGNHPAWPKGYIHGTFMYIRRDVIETLGDMDAANYPLWGSTCEYQLRACRKGFKALVIAQGKVPGFHHTREGGRGDSIQELLRRQPARRGWFIRTPPLVSVIVPAYNHGRYLPDAVNSLIGGPTSLGDVPGQTLQSFEIVIVDDGSTDNTPEIGAALADPWQGIYYLRQKNGGTPVANNTGIRASHGRYITILCADDMMEPDRLEYLLDAAQAYPHSVIYDDLFGFTKGKRTRQWHLPGYDFDTLLTKNHMHAGIFYPRAAWQEVGGYPEEMKYGREDWAFNVRLGIHGWCGVRINRAGYLYRRHNANRTLRNTSPNWHKRFLQQLRLLYPEVYAGARPMSCCGRGRSNTGRARPAAKKNGGGGFSMAGAEGMTLLQYNGRNEGIETWYGPETGQRYEFGRAKPVAYVDNRDVSWFLAVKETGRKVFGRYKRPRPAKVTPAPVVKEEETAPDVQDRAEIETKPLAPDPSDMSVSEIRQLLKNESLSVEQVRQMIDAEQAGKNRKSAIAALEAAASPGGAARVA